MVVVLTSCTTNCQGLIISVLSLASYVWRRGFLMMSILSYMLSLYWLVRTPLSAVNVSIKILLTIDPLFSIFFQACHACAVTICFGHVKKFSLPRLAIIPWLYVLTWADTCGLSSPLLYHLYLRTAQLPFSHVWFVILVVQFTTCNLLLLHSVNQSVKYSTYSLVTLRWLPKSMLCRLLMCVLSLSTTLDIYTLCFLAFKYKNGVGCPCKVSAYSRSQ